MPDDGGWIDTMQRTRGRAAVRLGPPGPGGGLRNLHQSGSAKAFLPRIHAPAPEVVFLNTAGGLTGGDRLSFALGLEDGARATGTTQTAERIYASAGGLAHVDVRLTLASGAVLHWLPQETILFDGAALARRTEADLAGDATLLLAECIVLGRAAMGEVIHRIDVSDWRCIRRAGVPVLVEPLRLTAATLGAGAAALNGARAFATIALIGPGAEDMLGPVRAALPEGIEAAASAWDGKCVIRLLGPDLFPVRRAMAAVLTLLRGGPLPRVWQV